MLSQPQLHERVRWRGVYRLASGTGRVAHQDRARPIPECAPGVRRGRGTHAVRLHGHGMAGVREQCVPRMPRMPTLAGGGGWKSSVGYTRDGGWGEPLGQPRWAGVWRLRTVVAGTRSFTLAVKFLLPASCAGRGEPLGYALVEAWRYHADVCANIRRSKPLALRTGRGFGVRVARHQPVSPLCLPVPSLRCEKSLTPLSLPVPRPGQRSSLAGLRARC